MTANLEKQKTKLGVAEELDDASKNASKVAERVASERVNKEINEAIARVDKSLENLADQIENILKELIEILKTKGAVQAHSGMTVCPDGCTYQSWKGRNPFSISQSCPHGNVIRDDFGWDLNAILGIRTKLLSEKFGAYYVHGIRLTGPFETYGLSAGVKYPNNTEGLDASEIHHRKILRSNGYQKLKATVNKLNLSLTHSLHDERGYSATVFLVGIGPKI